MSVQYFHNRQILPSGEFAARGGYTVAVEFLSPFTGQGGACFLNIGAAYCHPEDNYNKRLGRTIAAGRMKGAKGIIEVHEDDTNISVTLGDLHLICRVSASDKKLKLISIFDASVAR